MPGLLGAPRRPGSLSLATAPFQLVDRAWWGLGNQPIDAFEQAEDAQDADEAPQRGRFARLDALDGHSAHARFFGKLTLTQIALQPGTTQASAKLPQDRCISVLSCYVHSDLLLKHYSIFLRY